VPEQQSGLLEGKPELPLTSESEQMYLITVARAAEDGRSGPFPIAALAGTLEVSVASANEMVRKLEGKGLIEYLPYKGVELTGEGSRIAGRVLRTRRLWATFLVEHLDYSPGEGDALACHLEHVTPPEAAERLAAYLGNPAIGPLGNPIPDQVGSAPAPGTVPLLDMPAGGIAEVVAVGTDEDVRGFLAAEGIGPGSILAVAGAGRSGVLVEMGARRVHLAAGIAGHIEMRSTDAVG
jgi:DtxR family Mn-dependent transcriptional regulator